METTLQCREKVLAFLNFLIGIHLIGSALLNQDITVLDFPAYKLYLEIV